MRMAAQWAGYKWREFSNLDADEQNEIVATFEASKLIEAVNASETSKKIKRR